MRMKVTLQLEAGDDYEDVLRRIRDIVGECVEAVPQEDPGEVFLDLLRSKGKVFAWEAQKVLGRMTSVKGVVSGLLVGYRERGEEPEFSLMRENSKRVYVWKGSSPKNGKPKDSTPPEPLPTPKLDMLESLSEKQRLFLQTLFKRLDMKRSEIAQLVGVEEGSVGAFLAHVTRKTQKVYEKPLFRREGDSYQWNLG